jgi:hypothetical protein
MGAAGVTTVGEAAAPDREAPAGHDADPARRIPQG